MNIEGLNQLYESKYGEQIPNLNEKDVRINEYEINLSHFISLCKLRLEIFTAEIKKSTESKNSIIDYGNLIHALEQVSSNTIRCFTFISSRYDVAIYVTNDIVVARLITKLHV